MRKRERSAWAISAFCTAWAVSAKAEAPGAATIAMSSQSFRRSSAACHCASAGVRPSWPPASGRLRVRLPSGPVVTAPTTAGSASAAGAVISRVWSCGALVLPWTNR